MDCIFCNKNDGGVILNTRFFIARYDEYPVSPGHIIIIPKRHVEDYFLLTRYEREELFNECIPQCHRLLEVKYKPDGYNIGINCGEAAGQSIMHCHIHIIPRYKGDVENPRGGVRGVIPSKQNY